MADGTEKIIGSVAHGGKQVIVVREVFFKGRQFVDIRSFLYGRDGVLRPTTKGISISVSKFKDVRDLLNKYQTPTDLFQERETQKDGDQGCG